MDIRDLNPTDLTALQEAIDRDTFHSGEWTKEHFYQQSETSLPSVYTQVIENKNGPIAFVRYTKTLRISCVWNNTEETSRNAKAIILGIHNAAEMARASGFSEIVITTNYKPLADFFTKVLKMKHSQDEYFLQL
jgi:hypothetical protein